MTATFPSPELRVGRYRLLGVLGEGGMGVVHLAEDESGRRVALKLLRAHIVGDQEARQRLAQEVASLGRVTSPRIAEILDADPWGPSPYVATRYVPGPTLHAMVRERDPLPEAGLVWFAEGLADALLAVHRVGVLHRDIKPSNVLVEGRSPVLIDFGLARLAEDPRLTATGFLLGTPGYLAPEILLGDEATPAADVHALAATLTYAASGHGPYGSGPALAILDRVRLGHHDLDGVPDGLRSLLAACLDPDPLARPTLTELHRELIGRLGRDVAPVTVLPVSGGPATAGPPPTRVVPEPPVAQPLVAEPTPRATAVLPAQSLGQPLGQPLAAPPRPMAQPVGQPAAPPIASIAPEPDGSAHGRVGVALLGAGVLALAVVAWAPYAGAALIALVACLARFASVTTQRHRRRQQVRGRPRWYDVPASTLASPGYLVLSLLGSVALVGWAVATALAVAVVVALARPPLVPGLAVVAAVFVASLWWGPASGRVREIGRRMTAPLAVTRGRPWVALAFGIVGAAVILSLLAAEGPLWAPAASAPWTHGFLAELDRVLPHPS